MKRSKPTCLVMWPFSSITSSGDGGPDRKTSELMMDAWVRFAKTGSPSGGGLDWPSASAKGAPLLDINETPRVLNDYREDQLDLIDKLYARLLAEK